MKELITTFNRLKDYALWYYFRYYPSNKKLENKLLEKTDYNHDLVNQVIGDICHLFQEEEVIISRIKNYLFKNKNLNYIRQKLLQKQFLRNDIDKILNENFLEEGNSLLDKNSLLKKIEILKSKGKSIQYVKNKLIERNEDIELVELCINEVFDSNGELDNLFYEYEKLKNKYDKQKIIEKLLRKGFKYENIKNILDK